MYIVSAEILQLLIREFAQHVSGSVVFSRVYLPSRNRATLRNLLSTTITISSKRPKEPTLDEVTGPATVSALGALLVTVSGLGEPPAPRESGV